jgi:hypothetical protein
VQIHVPSPPTRSYAGALKRHSVNPQHSAAELVLWRRASQAQGPLSLSSPSTLPGAWFTKSVNVAAAGVDEQSVLLEEARRVLRLAA